MIPELPAPSPQTATPGTLYLVGTPIGNLADLTFRAHGILASVDIIACEDTRHSLALLQHYAIRKPLLSLHEHNEAGRSQQLLQELRSGRSIALISDAGMPLVSDPGQRLLHEIRHAGIPYEVIPGPSAPVTALVGSGLPATEFSFGGFLPVKSGQRRRTLEQALARDHTSVFFESPHRLIGTLEIIAEIAPERQICVARELTKKFQEYHTNTAGNCLTHYNARSIKGEITLVLAGTELPRWMTRDREPPARPLTSDL
jgi:16S rRNA (cytidine1402-2'-O)-methyltransferase